MAVRYKENFLLLFLFRLFFLLPLLFHSPEKAVAHDWVGVHRHNPVQYGEGVFDESIFRNRVDSALDTVRNLLEQNRSPTYAEDVRHTYDDKYSITEFLTNAAIAAQLNALERLGIDRGVLLELMDMSDDGKRAVTLRLAMNETCSFAEEKAVELEDIRSKSIVTDTTTTTKSSDTFNKEGSNVETKREERKVITQVKEYHWQVGFEYELFAFGGTESDNDQHFSSSTAANKNKSRKRISLLHRAANHRVVMTGNKRSPRPAIRSIKPIDLPLNWNLRNLVTPATDDGSDSASQPVCLFEIDRAAQTCSTPRRNNDIDGAVAFFQDLRNWGRAVHKVFINFVLGLPSTSASSELKARQQDLSSMNTDGLFVPVLPLLEGISLGEGTQPKGEEEKFGDEKRKGRDSILLHVGDINLFLEEQCRCLDRKLVALKDTYPPSEGENVLSHAEATLSLAALHLASIAEHYIDGVNYVEYMLRSQLVTAIGKEIGPGDFADFVSSYYRKLFRPEFVPRPFSFAVRRPQHSPEGTLMLVGHRHNKASALTPGRFAPTTSMTETVETVSRKLSDVRSMYFSINAATTVEFTGDRYLHALVAHEFGRAADETHSVSSFRSPNSGNNVFDRIELVARARQFSSFLLMIGKVSGPDTFLPQHAIILQNRDEVLIPILLERFPTPKEFRDATESLSPEQRRFAQAFRTMQLESSVFGVCVIQLKPQLERLLGLPLDSLTKEIRLTQDLLSLFIDYQIPSDLLKFDGEESFSVSEKVAVVRGHAAAVMDMIDNAKAKDLREAEEEMKIKKSMKQTRSLEDESMIMDTGYEEVMMTAQMDELQMMKKSHDRKQSIPMAAMVGASSSSSQHRRELRSISKQSLNVRKEREMPKESYSPPPVEPPINHRTSGGEAEEARDSHGDGSSVDFTMIPRQLDAKFEDMDEDAVLRSAEIKAGSPWERRAQNNLLLTEVESSFLDEAEQRIAKDKAFDLLDALSRSGTLPIECAELHVIVAAIHSFDRNLINTVVQDNINPIEKFEKSMLIVASTILGESIAKLVRTADEGARVAKYSPALLGDGKDLIGASPLTS